MKKIALFILLAPYAAFSQQAEGQSVITGGVGYSLLGKLISIVDIGSNSTESYASPVIHFAYDYGLTENMSLGLAVGYQKAGIRYSDYKYENSNNETITEDFEWSISRLNIGARALFHYGNNEKFDMYSGARFGFQSYTSTADTTNPDFDATDFKSGGLGMQLIAFGARGYFTENIGFNFEFALGSPYFIMGGLSCRLGGY